MMLGIKLRIKVTEDDIKNGTPKKAESCAIAVAIKRILKEELPGIKGVSVCPPGPVLFYNNMSFPKFKAKMPLEATLLARSFDETGIAIPTEFDLILEEAEVKGGGTKWTN